MSQAVGYLENPLKNPLPLNKKWVFKWDLLKNMALM